MKLLFIHADHIAFEARKKALRDVAELQDHEKPGRMEDALVVFYSVEAHDAGAPAGTVAKALEHVQNVAGQVKPKGVMLYPYAHLSNNLAKPADGKKIGDLFVEAVRGAGYTTAYAPFGWYKAFDLKAKGHPLAELSRDIKPGEAAVGAAAPTAISVPEGRAEPRESEALAREKKLKSAWYVLTTDGDLVPAAEFDFAAHPGLHQLYLHETAGTRKAEAGEPAHVRLMREMELVDYEPGSDPGNFRWYPKGQLVKRLLETHVSNIVADAGGVRVETPIMYDFAHPALSKYLNRFPARQYTIKSDEKEFFLRFAACFGQYLIMHDAVISYRHLPLRVYELTHYSFRREQRGELTGLRRLRAFTMPDMHTLVADMGQAKQEFKRQFERSLEWMRDLETPFEPAMRFVRSFFDEHRAFARELAELAGRPMLVEVWDERFFYFVMKFEFNVNDGAGKASALSTVQIDVENTERFDINYVDDAGRKKHPLLLHASISGSIDRNLYALLETAALRAREGAKPALPFWLAPTQVRFLPVSDDHVDACARLAEDLALAVRKLAAGIDPDDDVPSVRRQRLAALPGPRIDLDDRTEGVGRKIRDAEKEWIPFIVVFGDKEAARLSDGSGGLPVRVRGADVKEFTVGDLAREIFERQRGLPQAPLPLPFRLRDRPVFRG